MDIVSSWLLYITYINSILTKNQLPSVTKQATEDKFSKENGEGTKNQRKSLLPRPPFFLLWLCAAPAETVFSREIGRSKNKLTNKRKRVDSRIDTHTHYFLLCVNNIIVWKIILKDFGLSLIKNTHLYSWGPFKKIFQFFFLPWFLTFSHSISFPEFQKSSLNSSHFENSTEDLSQENRYRGRISRYPASE